MEEKSLALQQQNTLMTEVEKERSQLVSILHEENFASLKLTNLPNDVLIQALQYVIDVMFNVERKYKELERYETEAQTKRPSLEEKLNSTRQSVEEKKKLLEKTKIKAEKVKSKITSTWKFVLFICCFNPIGWIIGIILYIILKKKYTAHHSAQGLRLSAELYEKAGVLERELLKEEAELKAGEENIDREVRLAEERLDNFSLNFQYYLNSEPVDWALNALSDDYMDYSIIRNLIRYLQSGRADNLKEAINLYETEQHRGRLELMQQATLETSQATLETSQATLAATEQTAESMGELARTSAESAAQLKDIKNMLKQGQKIRVNVKFKQEITRRR